MCVETNKRFIIIIIIIIIIIRLPEQEKDYKLDSLDKGIEQCWTPCIGAAIQTRLQF